MPVKESPARIRLPAIREMVLWQFLTATCLAALVWLWNRDAALAIAYGSAIFLIPNTYFAWQAFRYSGAAKAGLVTRAIYKGQAAKFLLTAVMFAAVFKAGETSLMWLVFVSYGINAAMHSMATSMVIKTKELK